jgi:oxygen-independent coproporphyrinogen-3 oxidase
MLSSLYVHIPFCLNRCIYCDFVSGIYNPDEETAYIAALKKEIGTIPPHTLLKTLYIGGGTPTVISIESLSGLIAYISGHCRFDDGYEATIEANPGTLNMEKLRAVLSYGINRISIGVQSFHAEELECLGRMHSPREAKEAVHLAGDAGFDNIGIDLIYGIPNQNLISWMNTLETAVRLGPSHISAYELTREDGTLYDEYVKDGTMKPLKDERVIEMYEYAVDCLASEGYNQYEISNFAKPGYDCAHNINYWDRIEYYGAGLGAHSFINGKRHVNTVHLREYTEALTENRSPVSEEEDIRFDKGLSEAIFLGLRKTRGINLRDFYKRYGIDIPGRYKQEIRKLMEDGFIEIEGADGLSGMNRYLRLTRKGMLLSNEVFVNLIQDALIT